MAESATLVLLGGGLGLALAFSGVALLRRVLPADIPRVDQIGINAPVLAFTIVASLFAGVLFGLYPATGSDSISPRRKSTFLYPPRFAFARARTTIWGVMSTPITRPDGPTDSDARKLWNRRS